jgi:hypothetical protein
MDMGYGSWHACILTLALQGRSEGFTSWPKLLPWKKIVPGGPRAAPP